MSSEPLPQLACGTTQLTGVTEQPLAHIQWLFKSQMESVNTLKKPLEPAFPHPSELVLANEINNDASLRVSALNSCFNSFSIWI